MEKLKIYKIQGKESIFYKNLRLISLKRAKRKNLNWCNLNHYFKYVVPARKTKGIFLSNISDNKMYHGFVCASSREEARGMLNEHLSGVRVFVD